MLLLLTLACTTIHGNGDMVEVPLTLEPFTEVEAHTFVDVEHAPSDVSAAVVRCDANLLPFLSVAVYGGVLAVQFPPNMLVTGHGDCRVWLEGPCLEAVKATDSGDVSVGDAACALRDVHVTGSGDVTVAGSTADALDLTVSGSGGVRLESVAVGSFSARVSGSGGVGVAGTCDSADVRVSGSGGVAGRDLVCRLAEIQVSGSGGVELTVTEAATATTTSSGDIDLWGGCSVDRTETGSGQVTLH